MCRLDRPNQEVPDRVGNATAEHLLASGDSRPAFKDAHLRLVQERYRTGTGAELDPEKLLELIQSLAKPPEVTETQRAQAYGIAGKALEDGLSSSVPPATAARMRSMQASVLSGDAKSIQDNLKGLSPEQVEAMAQDIEKNLTAFGSFTHVATDPSGNLIVFNESSSKAVKIFRDGKKPPDLMESSVDQDGDRLFKPADFQDEKKKIGDVLKLFGDTAIVDVTRTPEDIKIVRALKALSAEQMMALLMRLIQETMPTPTPPRDDTRKA